MTLINNMINDRTEMRSGQTLAEIVVVLGVVLLLVTGLVVGATGSLKAARFAKAKSIAMGYAQEGMEIVRNIRDTGWGTFQGYGDTSGKLWCLDKSKVWTDAASLPGGLCPVNNIPDVFTPYSRKVYFKWTDTPAQMRVDVGVTWRDGIKTYEATLSSYFTQWR